jgi:(2S)-methylsuccinyl-CoA dehydrogenase
MAHDGQDLAFQLENSTIIVDLLDKTREASAALNVLFETAREQMKSEVVVDGKTSGKLLEDNQDAAHGLAWLATYSTAMQQMQSWAEKLEADGEFGEIEQLLHQIGSGEYHAQVLGGIPMSQGEIIRLVDIGLLDSAIEKYRTKKCSRVVKQR